MANQIKNSNNETLFIKAPEVAVLMDVIKNKNANKVKVDKKSKKEKAQA